MKYANDSPPPTTDDPFMPQISQHLTPDDTQDKVISKTDSDILSIARFVMIASLVIHHVFTIPNSGFFPRFSLTDETLSAANILNALLHWSSMAAVPILSIASGFLFFSSNRSYAEKFRRRMLTIVLPTVLWGAIWLSVSYALYMVGHEKGLFEWANYGFDNPSLMTVIDGVLGITQTPIAFQFWFIHDLILTLCLAPLISLSLNKAFWVTLITLLAVWVSDLIPSPFFYGNVLMFFTLGAALQKRTQSLEAAIIAIWPFRYLVLTLFALALAGRAFNGYIHEGLASYPVLCVLRILGVLSSGIIILGCYNRKLRILSIIQALSPYSFFIFAAHYPTIEFIKTIIQRIPGQSSELGLTLSLFAIPTLTITLCILGALALKRILPRAYNLLNGQRG